jgi:hypothetical protein
MPGRFWFARKDDGGGGGLVCFAQQQSVPEEQPTMTRRERMARAGASWARVRFAWDSGRVSEQRSGPPEGNGRGSAQPPAPFAEELQQTDSCWDCACQRGRRPHPRHPNKPHSAWELHLTWALFRPLLAAGCWLLAAGCWLSFLIAGAPRTSEDSPGRGITPRAGPLVPALTGPCRPCVPARRARHPTLFFCSALTCSPTRSLHRGRTRTLFYPAHQTLSVTCPPI